MTKVLQCDREAAEALLNQQAIRYHIDGTFRDWDNSVLAFARHREEAQAELLEALEAMVHEWEKMTRYGSPMAVRANANLRFTKSAIANARGAQ